MFLFLEASPLISWIGGESLLFIDGDLDLRVLIIGKPTLEIIWYYDSLIIFCKDHQVEDLGRFSIFSTKFNKNF